MFDSGPDFILGKQINYQNNIYYNLLLSCIECKFNFYNDIRYVIR